MKAVFAALMVISAASFAQAHGRTGSSNLCQARFADAQTARAVCAAHGYGWERWSSKPSSHNGGYICSCGTFDPSKPGSDYNSPF